MIPSNDHLRAATADDRVCALSAWIQSLKLRISHEKLAQLDLEHACRENGIEYDREVVLEDGVSVPDFVIHCVAVELKVKGGVMAIFRQVERYAQNQSVHGIVLATASTMRLPATVAGKPARRASISAGWL